MINELILVVLLFMYWLGEAATEAYTHMSGQERLENPVIKSGWTKANAGLDYHTWRTLEYVGIIGTVLYLLPAESRIWYIGMTFIAWFFYQRLLGFARFGVWFPVKADYNIGALMIPHKKWLDWIVLTSGVALTWH